MSSVITGLSKVRCYGRKLEITTYQLCKSDITQKSNFATQVKRYGMHHNVIELRPIDIITSPNVCTYTNYSI